MLRTFASFYDPLGIMAPVPIEGKHLYRLAVDEKKGWDKEVSNELQVKWKKWIYGLKTVEVPRSIAPYLEDVTAVILHHLMDASKKAVSAEIIAIVVQPSGKTQGLLSSKARLRKRGLSMPSQELVSCQMGANLATNTSNALKGLPLKENNCWTDRKVALCWLTKPFKNWKTFVANRVRKIEEITRSWNITWRYVRTDMNHADYGTRTSTVEKLHEIGWWEGPDWLFDESN